MWDLTPLITGTRSVMSSLSTPTRLALSTTLDFVIKEKEEALGEVLNGDRLVSAPYKFNFRDDKESAVVCRKNLSKEEVV
ncbi:hypothetical protein AB3S75_013462 [Citrus x aurantiifolia]